MARIECTVKWDGWKATVSYEVLQIDAGDELIFNTDTDKTALRWKGECPFNKDTMPEVYPLPLVTAPLPQPHKASKAATLTPTTVECGVINQAGNFTIWPGGFPDIGTHHGGHRG